MRVFNQKIQAGEELVFRQGNCTDEKSKVRMYLKRSRLPVASIQADGRLIPSDTYFLKGDSK
jgi:hypothetical protein